MPLSASEAIDEPSPAINGHDASIRPVCMQLAARVNAFLDEDPETPALKAVQEQTRVALGVIHAALDRYRYYASSASVLSRK